MKALSKNPVIMKPASEPNFHFSAYPLKAISKADAEKKSILHIHTGKTGLKKYVVSTKVLPMVNPYKEKSTRVKHDMPNRDNAQPDHIEDRDAEWFSSYE